MKCDKAKGVEKCRQQTLRGFKWAYQRVAVVVDLCFNTFSAVFEPNFSIQVFIIVLKYCLFYESITMSSNLHEIRSKNDLYPSFSFGWSLVGYVLSSVTILLTIYAWIISYENTAFGISSHISRQLASNDTISPVAETTTNQTYIPTTQLVANISVFGAMIMSSYGQAFKQEALGIVKGSKEDLELSLERTRREEIFKNRLTHAVSVISRLPFPVAHWPPMFAQVYTTL